MLCPLHRQQMTIENEQMKIDIMRDNFTKMMIDKKWKNVKITV